MITKETIDSIKSAADIVSVASDLGMSPKKQGKLWAVVCPFHQDHDPSMKLYPDTGTYHCYVCEAHGDVFDLVMEVNNCEFIDAAKWLAKKYGIEVKEESKPRDPAKEEHENRQRTAMKLATEWYQKQLWAFKGQPAPAKGEKDPTPLDYALNRFNEETLHTWQIGYAPETWDGLLQHLRANHVPDAVALEMDLIKPNEKGGYYDTFRGRIMFPVRDKRGRVIAFSGRDITGKHKEKKAAKYLNSAETALYKKSQVLFGLDQAIQAIRKYDVCILVEGNADVVHMHQIGVHNVVAACGTALSSAQIEQISTFTNNIALLYDCDNAGRAAAEKSARLISESGKNTIVLTIPEDEDGNKQDPDSYFKNKTQFKTFYNSFKKTYWVMLAEMKAENCENDSAYRSRTMKEIASLFYKRGKTEIATIIEELASVIPTKALWGKAVKELYDDDKSNERLKESEERTAEQNEMYTKYGFFVKDHCYWFHSLKGEGMFQGSNFDLKPLFHIESTINAKRLYEITNTYGVKRVIEFKQKDLITPAAFRLCVESLGNFLFDGGEMGLAKIKRYLYEKTDSCKEITQLGWQREGFYAWGNGIVSNGKFIPVNDYGIVRHENENYYIPATSAFYRNDRDLFQFERIFVHNTESYTTINEWWILFSTVYGVNAVAGLAFYVASLFRDHIFAKEGFFPIYNIFGVRGSGKTAMAKSMMQLFGHHEVDISMKTTTLPSLADAVARTSNAICHIDEYKNDIEYDRMEFLKGAWNGIGRSRMNMDRDKKKETTPVNCGLILTGQDMPTADNALFTRVIFTRFSKTGFTEEESKMFKRLDEMEKRGLTGITNSILAKRDEFIKFYDENRHHVEDEMCTITNKSEYEDRIWRDWAIMVNACKCILSLFHIDMNYDYALKELCGLMKIQQSEAKSENDVAIFWRMFKVLAKRGEIEDGYDFCIKTSGKFTLEKKDILCDGAPMTIIGIDLAPCVSLYRQLARKEGVKTILDSATIEYYLTNSPEYLGRWKKRVKVRTDRLNGDRVRTDTDNNITVQTTTSRLYAFDYKRLNLDIDVEWEAQNKL